MGRELGHLRVLEALLVLFDATILPGGNAAFAFSDEKIALKRRGCLLFLFYVILFSTAGST